MPVSYTELKAMLDVDEPDYAALADVAAGAMQHLRKLAASTDVSLASKAVSLAGIVGDDRSIPIVEDAAKSRQPIVRVAAAHAASLLPNNPEVARVVNKLLDDADIGVVKTATRAAARQTDQGLAAKAKRANARMGAAVRAAAKANTRQERATAMATKGRKKAVGSGGGTKLAAKNATGQMPTGVMTGPPKGAKTRAMPTGKMR